MVRYILIRILWLLVVLFIVLSIVYLVSHFLQLLFWEPRSVPMSSKISRTFSGYVEYFTNVLFHRDLGVTRQGEEISELMRERVPLSLRINLYAFSLAIVFGVLFGILTAIKKGTIIDYVITTFLMVYSSIPPFIWMFSFMIVFGWQLEWLPPAYPTPAWFPTPWTSILGYVLPVIALIGMPLSGITQILRGELVEVFHSDHINLARVKGLKRYQVILRHTLRNSALPVVQKLPELFSVMLFNSFLVEFVYYVPGVARLFFTSILMRWMDAFLFRFDPPVLVAVTGFYVILKIASDIVVDTTHVLIDPRVSMGHKK